MKMLGYNVLKWPLPLLFFAFFISYSRSPTLNEHTHFKPWAQPALSTGKTPTANNPSHCSPTASSNIFMPHRWADGPSTGRSTETHLPSPNQAPVK